MTDRIDFLASAAGTIVQKFERQPWRDRLISSEIKPQGFNLEAALEWCTNNGYTVRVGTWGARAWKGQPWVIRTRYQIKRRREQAERAAFSSQADPHTTSLQIDFALDG